MYLYSIYVCVCLCDYSGYMSCCTRVVRSSIIINLMSLYVSFVPIRASGIAMIFQHHRRHTNIVEIRYKHYYGFPRSSRI